MPEEDDRTGHQRSSGLATFLLSLRPVIGSTIVCQSSGCRAPGMLAGAEVEGAGFSVAGLLWNAAGRSEVASLVKTSDDGVAVAKRTPSSLEAVVR